MSNRTHNPNWKAEQRALTRRANTGLIHPPDATKLVFTDRQMERDPLGTVRRTTVVLKSGMSCGLAKLESAEIKGIAFYSQSRKQDMMLVTEGQWDGWLIYKHPDGDWVSLRHATQRDRDELAKAAKAQP